MELSPQTQPTSDTAATASQDCAGGPGPGAFCPIHEGLRILQGAWTPEVLWQLRQGPKRFGELRRALGRISAKVLTTRLRELEQRGLLERRVLASSPPSVEYRLTSLAHEIQPVLCSIAELGTKLHERRLAIAARQTPAVIESAGAEPSPRSNGTAEAV
jgi:DNA-binding HxlR family transcriptional regulator